MLYRNLHRLQKAIFTINEEFLGRMLDPKINIQKPKIDQCKPKLVKVFSSTISDSSRRFYPNRVTKAPKNDKWVKINKMNVDLPGMLNGKS